MNFKTLVISLFLVILVAGCGYKPSSYYAKQELGDKIYVDLEVNISDPKNSVIIKDIVNETLIHRLGSKLVYEKKQADTIMVLKYNNISLNELSYDSSGYIKLYRVNTSINVAYTNENNKKKNFDLTSHYEFSIETGGTISDANRFEAIKTASKKALDELLSKLAIENFK